MRGSPDWIPKDLFNLYYDMLKQSVKDQYKGHEDYVVLLDAIHSKVPIVGGKVNIQKEAPDGTITTRSYQIIVKDDLGHILNGPDDIGGQCVKGEIVKKGHIFICMVCGDLFCRRHVKFVDNNPEKPLCHYGFLGWEGCHFGHAHKYSVGDQIELERLKHEIEKKKLLAELERAETQQYIDVGQSQDTLALPKKTGAVKRLIHGNAYFVRCGNCNEKIWFSNIVCPACRNTISIDVDASLKCPVCGEPIRQVECHSCEGINTL